MVKVTLYKFIYIEISVTVDENQFYVFFSNLVYIISFFLRVFGNSLEAVDLMLGSLDRCDLLRRFAMGPCQSIVLSQVAIGWTTKIIGLNFSSSSVQTKNLNKVKLAITAVHLLHCKSKARKTHLIHLKSSAKMCNA